MIYMILKFLFQNNTFFFLKYTKSNQLLEIMLPIMSKLVVKIIVDDYDINLRK